MTAANVSPAEIARFDQLAARWWDPDGESRPLHDLNPVRTAYIAARADLRGARVARTDRWGLCVGSGFPGSALASPM
jgi:2-polyprenyl-6-hydroxyphenyl methylase/3-demethylubiquinone-9 3-methyltransferase